MHDVDPVREKIGHRAAAKVPIPAPEIEFVFAEGLIGSTPEPLLPVERLCVDGLARPGRQIVLPPIGPHLRHAPEAAALNEIDGVAKMAPTALLHAALQYLLAGAYRTRECRALLDDMGDRFFQINVFARL